MIYLKYLKYVVKHKWFVFIECCKLGVPFRGLVHDMSKFLPSEFIPYARYFYGEYLTVDEIVNDYGMGDYSNAVNFKSSKENIGVQFDLAWLKHLKRNPHHYQYWILNEADGDTKCLQIPTKYMLEMIADWRGAGRAITGKDNLSEWFTANKSNIKSRMSIQTYESVCKLIGENK